MAADIIAFPPSRIRPAAPVPPVADRPAEPGDRVVILAEGKIGQMIGMAWSAGETRAILLVDGATRYISPLRIAPLGTGPGPKGAA